MENSRCIDKLENDRVLVETIEQTKLSGARSGFGAERVFYLDKSGVKLSSN